jgi:hypothetical protein
MDASFTAAFHPLVWKLGDMGSGWWFRTATRAAPEETGARVLGSMMEEAPFSAARLSRGGNTGGTGFVVRFVGFRTHSKGGCLGKGARLGEVRDAHALERPRELPEEADHRERE